MSAGALTVDSSSEAGQGRPARAFGEFLATGGATLLLIPLAHWYESWAGLERSEYVVSFAAFYAAYLVNDPHFAVSYLLFYKNAGLRLFGPEYQGAQRLRYLVAGFVVPLMLVGWITVALVLQSAAILGAMVQLMFFLVGWHYVKQGFGVLMVLSSRRSVFFSKTERTIALAHCFSAWAYAWSSPRQVGSQYEESGVVYTALTHPPGLELLTQIAFLLSTLLLCAAGFVRARRGDPLPPLSAATGFFMALWLWTVYSAFNPLIAYVIPGLHSLQYWYFVYLLKNNEARSAVQAGTVPASLVGRLAQSLGPIRGRLALFFATSVGLSWLAFNGVPGFLDEYFVASTARLGPDPSVSSVSLGLTPYVAAFSTFINIHHYFLDHVIWRRENPDTRFLRDA